MRINCKSTFSLNVNDESLTSVLLCLKKGYTSCLGRACTKSHPLAAVRVSAEQYVSGAPHSIHVALFCVVSPLHYGFRFKLLIEANRSGPTCESVAMHALPPG